MKTVKHHEMIINWLNWIKKQFKKKYILKVGVKNRLRHKSSLGHLFGILYNMGDVLSFSLPMPNYECFWLKVQKARIVKKKKKKKYNQSSTYH